MCANVYHCERMYVTKPRRAYRSDCKWWWTDGRQPKGVIHTHKHAHSHEHTGSARAETTTTLNSDGDVDRMQLRRRYTTDISFNYECKVLINLWIFQRCKHCRSSLEIGSMWTENAEHIPLRCTAAAWDNVWRRCESENANSHKTKRRQLPQHLKK